MRVWLNGAIVPVADARVSVLDHGFTVGDGVFETLKVVGGRPFAPTRHIRRLLRSAAAIGMPAPDAELVACAIAEATAVNASDTGPLGRLRVTWTSGAGPLGSERGDGPGTLVAYCAPGAPWPPTTQIATVPWPRNERGALAGVKSTSYGGNAVALARAGLSGASEAVMPNTRGNLCEGTGSNVFLVVDGAIATPPLSSGCLAGITRELVCEWFEVRQEDIAMADLGSADEVFLTSSTRDVHPVARVDGRTTRSMTAGVRLAAQFAARAAQDMDP